MNVWVLVPRAWLYDEAGNTYLSSGGRSIGPVIRTVEATEGEQMPGLSAEGNKDGMTLAQLREFMKLVAHYPDDYRVKAQTTMRGFVRAIGVSEPEQPKGDR